MIIIVPVLDVPPFQGLISFFGACSQGDAPGFHRAPFQGLAISPNGAPCDSPGQRPGCLVSQIFKP